MLKPRALRPGDRVAIVAPSSPILPEKMENGLALLRELGLEPVLMPNVFERDYYLAGTDQQRAQDLSDAFSDPQFAGVICARGGYGCARLLPYLNFETMAATKKFFAGFSDVTTLHLALNKCGLVTFHAPMLLSWSRERQPWVRDSFARCLRGEDSIVNCPRAETITEGPAEGVLTGGCLCLLTDSIGTEYAFDGTDKLVLIEDVDENPHRIDAMLTHLLNTGTIQKARGIIVGEMTGTDEREDATIGSKPWRDIFRERLGPLGIPMVFDFPMGHAATMLSIPLGVNARLDATAGTLTLLESPCAE